MPSDGSHASSGRRYVLIALKLSVSIVLLAYLFSRVDMASLWDKARNASVSWLVVALLLYGFNVLVSTWRWHLLLQAQNVAISRGAALQSFLVATFFSN